MSAINVKGLAHLPIGGTSLVRSQQLCCSVQRSRMAVTQLSAGRAPTCHSSSSCARGAREVGRRIKPSLDLEFNPEFFRQSLSRTPVAIPSRPNHIHKLDPQFATTFNMKITLLSMFAFVAAVAVATP